MTAPCSDGRSQDPGRLSSLPQKQQQTWLLLPVSVMDTPVFRMNGQKAPPAFPDLRGSLQRRSDGGPCPAFMCPPPPPAEFSGRTQTVQHLGAGRLVHCGVVCGFLHSALCSGRAILAAASLPAVHGLFSCLSRSGHSPCVFLAIRGTRQLKASGNLGFMDVSQRPGQAPSVLLGRLAPPCACLSTCCPCTWPVGS